MSICPVRHLSKLAAVVLVGATMMLASVGAPSSVHAAEAAQPAKAAKKIRIGVSIPAAEHGWTAGVQWWAKRAMKLYPDIDWSLSTANTAEKQIADIEDMAAKGIDGLVILCTESAPLTPAAKKLKEKGVFIVNVDRGFTDEKVADIFLEGDNKAFGKTAAEFIVKKLEGKGSIVILEGIPCTVNTDRVSAAVEVFKQHPEIKILGQQPGMWNREKALEVMENFLSKHKKIDAVWAADDDMAMGVLQAATEAGRAKDLWVVGGGGMKDIVKKVLDKDPQVPATVTYPPSMIAAGIHTAASALRDGNKDKIAEFMPRHLKMDVELVTPENAKAFYFPDSVY
jgi:ribose transport system substrate-binding protein